MDSTERALRADLARIQDELDEANATLRAISNGEVDALMVRRDTGDHVLMVEGVDRPYHLLAERMHQAAITISADGTILYANPATANLLNIPLQQLIGTRLDDYAAPAEHDAFAASLRRAQVEEVEHEVHVRRDGSGFFPMHVAASPLLERDQVVCVIMTDLTERERLLEEHAARIALESTAAVLREDDRRKDEFLAMLAHELRGPLAPIRNGLEVMRMSAADQRSGELTEMMSRQVENLVRLVDDLLDVSRVTHGKIRLAPEQADLRQLVARAVDSVLPEMSTRELRLELHQPPIEVPVFVDPVRATQIFTNLLNNAMKFTPSGGKISVDVSVTNDRAVARVRDSGIGIAAELLPGIFDLFTQVDPSVSRSEGGLGIGLTLARRLAELHEGSLEAHSEGLGHGAEFVLELPLATSSLASGGPNRAASSTERPRALRIMVVDDNRDAAESMAMLLTLRGHAASCEFDGESALATALNEPPDLMLLDIGLPGIDGYEVASRIRASGLQKSPRLIALSGYASDADRRRSHEAGFDEHLAKPVDFHVLEQLLEVPMAPFTSA